MSPNPIFILAWSMISAPSFFIILQRHQWQSTFSMSSKCMFSVTIKKNIIMMVSFWSRVMWWKCCVTCLGVDQNEEEKGKDNVHRCSGSNVFCWKANQHFCFTCLRVGSWTMWNLSSLLHKSHLNEFKITSWLASPLIEPSL